MQILNIGRNISNTIVLNDDMVSRQHAQLIILNNGQVLIKDLGSTNGTFVNGNRVRECYLKPADSVKCAGLLLDWPHFVSGNNTANAQTENAVQSHDADELYSATSFGDIQKFTLRDTIKYIASRIFNVGDLFRSEWDNRTTILFFFLVPVIVFSLGGLLLYFTFQANSYSQPEASLLKILLQSFAIPVSCFGISQLLAFSLLTIKRETSLRKNLLASSIFSFLEFMIVAVATIAGMLLYLLTDEGVSLRFLSDPLRITSGSGMHILFVFICLAAFSSIIKITITLIIFIYNYFRSIDVSKGISIHLTVLTLAVSLLAQFCFVYLIIAFI